MFWPGRHQNRLSRAARPARRLPARTLGALALAIGLTGCSRDNITTYQVPKESRETTSHAAHGDTAPLPSAPVVRWTLPAGWQELEPSQFRVGDFRIRDDRGRLVEVSIIPLPGQAGSDLDNLNRWRAQVGLKPVTEAEMTASAEPITVGDGVGRLFDLYGAAPYEGDPVRMLAVIRRREGVAWFIKMQGPDDLVVAQRPAFVSLLEGLRFGEVPPAGERAAAASPAAPPPDTGDPRPVGWQIPGSWSEVPAGLMQLARFNVAGDSGESGEASVAVLGGDGGGMLANVNRWRRQMGLAPVAPAELAGVVRALPEVAPGASLVVIDAPAENRQMRVVVVPLADESWFYRLTGSADLVSRQEPALIAFAQSAQHGR